MIRAWFRQHAALVLFTFVMLVVISIYLPGLSGGWLFDDYPNIIDNHAVQPATIDIPELVRAALSSPSSEFKRPLASLSFAANYLATGLQPFWWKVTNLSFHLLNGLLVFLLARTLMSSASPLVAPQASIRESIEISPTTFKNRCGIGQKCGGSHTNIIAVLIAAGWLVLPINLTAVLYVVQRMESMANLFVLLGLLGYVAGRRRMLAGVGIASNEEPTSIRTSPVTNGFILCNISLVVPTISGVLAKETAVMLPLYALMIEWALFQFGTSTSSPDWRIVGSFTAFLVLPLLLGLSWLLPTLLKPETWATRDFTMGTRLLSEARIVLDYVFWTLLPVPSALSFYHDDFVISTGLLAPASTVISIVLLAALIAFACWQRRRRPLVALGIALFLSCHLLTGTILSLELIYEHRNYFASFGLMLAIVPLLAAPKSKTDHAGKMPMAVPRHMLLAVLMLYWTTMTALTAYSWGDPLRLAQDLAKRAPYSPRAQYELGRTYIIYSHYDKTSPFIALAYDSLERAANLPNSSILPQQALIFMNSRMRLPLKRSWWDSMIFKLQAHPPGVQDESSLASLTQCAREGKCELPPERMKEAFVAALSHAAPTATLQATYGDYAWNVLHDNALGERMTAAAVETSPTEPAYKITLIRMLVALGRKGDAREILQHLETLNISGRLDNSITSLKLLISQS